MSQPALRPLDVVVALQLALRPEEKYEALASTLAVAVSAAHRAVTRLEAAGLILPHRRAAARSPLIDFIVHGVPYSFFAVIGSEAPGVPTAYSAPPLAASIESDRPLVWPSIQGAVRGDTLLPLYPGAPSLPGRDPALYEVLTLVDALRVGRARERRIAAEMLEDRIPRGGG
jgi:hypothetical protein